MASTPRQTRLRPQPHCQDTVEQRIHQMRQEEAKLAAGLLANAAISQKLSPEMARALLEE